MCVCVCVRMRVRSWCTVNFELVIPSIINRHLEFCTFFTV